MTYNEISQLLTAPNRRRKINKHLRKLAYATWAINHLDGSFGIIYHTTEILTFYPDDSVRLNTGGWFTITTKTHLNKYGPVRVYSDRNVWYIWPLKDWLTNIVPNFNWQNKDHRKALSKAEREIRMPFVNNMIVKVTEKETLVMYPNGS